MRRYCLPVLFCVALCGLTKVGTALADNIRPLLVELRELHAGVFEVWRHAPASLPGFYQPDVRMPESCNRVSSLPEANRIYTSELYRCERGLRGQSLAIVYPGPNPSVPTAMRIRFANGTQLSTLLGPEQSSWIVPRAETWSGVAQNYTVLGIRHILFSLDHLLFVVCLLWISGGQRRVLTTITGFTMAHSVTLGMAVLHIVRIPVAPVEASIALSILFLAGEIARGPRDTVSWRYPIVVASTFGLLHGLGFAAALTDIGLPQTQLLAGLFFFNVGVELGQIAFIIIVLSLERALKLTHFRFPRLVARVPIYLVGVLSAWWTLERVAAIFLVGQ